MAGHANDLAILQPEPGLVDRSRRGVFVTLRRSSRKHRIALIVVLLFNLILFYPSIFLGRVISPIDILSRYDPFATLRPALPQNGSLHDIATSYLGLLDLPTSDPGSFHWNRYVGSGIPGFGSVAAGVVSPFALLPALLLPSAFICWGILLLKINVAFFFGYLWLRQERLGKIPAAAGAITLCGSGIYAVWWLWPSTNAIALYPALLFLVARLAGRRRVSFLLASLIALSFALAGFPATIAYGAWTAVLYAAFLMLRERSVPFVPLAKALAGVAVAMLISAPFVAPFVRFLLRTGYLERRENASSEMFYPLDHLASFLDPYRLGNSTAHLWFGDSRLQASNNFVEATVFLGVVPLLLIVPGLFARRGRSRFFWLTFGAIILSAMFGMPFISGILGSLPGIEYSPLTRLRFLLPLPVAYLAACGVAFLMRPPLMRRMTWPRPLAALVGAAAGVAIALPLAFFAAGFYPYIERDAATVPESPSVSFLHSQEPPFRIAPAFNWLFPNSSELYRLEDIRSHFSSEEKYRRILGRIDPGSFGTRGTVITFNSLHFDVRDPFTSFLNVRYLVEQPSIDILRWEVEKDAIPNGTLSGEIDLLPGTSLSRWLVVPEAFGIELVIASVLTTENEQAELVITLSREGDQAPLLERRIGGEALRMSKVNLPLPESLTTGHRVRLEVRSSGAHVRLLQTEPVDGEDPLFVRFTTSPLILLREFPDGRIFENLGALPRHYAVWDTRVLGFDELLADEGFDPRTEAVISAPAPEVQKLAAIPVAQRDARVRVTAYTASSARIETRSSTPFLLATSEKLTPDLRVSVDGRSVSPIEINGLFAGVLVGEGTREVRLERRIGRGLWLPSALGVVLLGVGAVYERRRRDGELSS